MEYPHPANVITQTVQIPLPDAPPMGGYLARPNSDGTHPGVIVGMELFGISAHVRDVCERLARLGYFAVAPDLYHRSAPGVELAEEELGRTRGFELLNHLTRRQAISDIRAALDYVHASCSRIAGMVGLSVGGHIAYLAATELDLPAVAVVYGGWLPTTAIPISRPEPTLAATASIRGKVLFLVGEHDHLIPPEHRRAIADALNRADKRYEFIEYPGAIHGFLSDRRAAYEPNAAADAWRRITELLTNGVAP